MYLKMIAYHMYIYKYVHSNLNISNHYNNFRYKCISYIKILIYYINIYCINKYIYEIEYPHSISIFLFNKIIILIEYIYIYMLGDDSKCIHLDVKSFRTGKKWNILLY